MGHRLRTIVTFVASVAALVLLAGAPAALASKADDVKTARQGVLVSSDFPSGWSGTRNTDVPDAQAIKIASRIPACKDYVKLRKLMIPLAEARSLSYDNGAGTTLDNNVRAFGSEAKAKAGMALFGSDKNPDCLAKFTETALDEGWTASVERTELTGLPSGTVAYTANIADGTGAVVQQYRTIVVPAGRYVAVYNIGVTTSDPPIDVIDAAAATSLTRLGAAIGS
jgi:hypothetical protein